jgi:hypothetical protein
MVSLPSAITAAFLNPATVSFDRGFGVEAIHHSRNPVAFSLASGTGRTGAALISPSLENSFFGNRVIEIDDEYFERVEEKQRYKSRKLNLAFGGKLINRKRFGVDGGIMLKRHEEIKRINPGAGLSFRLGPFHAGGSVYQDDFHLELKDYLNPYSGLPYQIQFGSDTYEERFLVTSYTAGVGVKNLSFDIGVIRSQLKFYEEDIVVKIYSTSYRRNNWLFSLAIRNETSDAMAIENNQLVFKENKSETYLGAQYSLNRHIILGLHYNYFLLRETAISATLFY